MIFNTLAPALVFSSLPGAPGSQPLPQKWELDVGGTLCCCWQPWHWCWVDINSGLASRIPRAQGTCVPVTSGSFSACL